MWTDPIVADIHAIRASITEQVGDSSHALTLEAERLAKQAMEKFDMHWQSTAARIQPDSKQTRLAAAAAPTP